MDVYGSWFVEVNSLLTFTYQGTMISTHSSKKQKTFCPALCWDHSVPLNLYKLQLTWTLLSVTFPFFIIRSILGAILSKVLRRRVGTCPSSYLFSSSASFSAVRPVGKWRVTTINWRKQSSKIMIIYSSPILCYWSTGRSNYLAILTEQAWSKRPQRELFTAGPNAGNSRWVIWANLTPLW